MSQRPKDMLEKRKSGRMPVGRNGIRLLLPAALLLALVWGCRSRAVGNSSDGGLNDAGMILDAGDMCVEKGSPMALAIDIDDSRVPDQVNGDTDQYDFTGQVTYHGPVTEPISPDRLLDREIRISLGPNDPEIVIAYHLPYGLTLPVETDRSYRFLYRIRWAQGPVGQGLVIHATTSGINPYLFVGDTGPMRTFLERETSLFPVKVTVEPRDECPPVEDTMCGGMLHFDQLQFQGTDDQGQQITLVPGDTGKIILLGDSYRAVDMASAHLDMTCPDMPPDSVSYLVIRQGLEPTSCNRDLFYIWDEPTPDLGVGDWCDDLVFCATAAQAEAAQAVAPHLRCQVVFGDCDGGDHECSFRLTQNIIDETTLDEMCAVSVLPDPPDSIQCHRYYDTN